MITNILVQRIEKGWPGHFICAKWCLFRRHTLLSYDGVHISVSSVGNLMYDKEERKIETIGVDRYFETMAFHSFPKTETDPWQDANVSLQISFNSPWSIDQPWKEQEANDMHEAVVAEITTGLLAGHRYEIKDY